MVEQIDYELIFQATPSPAVVLTPDFEIVAANRAYLTIARCELADLIGKNLFDVFPDSPGGQGPKLLRASLEQVAATRERDVMPLYRYDIEDPDHPGIFDERYWSPINWPVLGPSGEVILLVHRVEEVTAYFRQLRQARGEGATGDDLEVLETVLLARARELQELNQRLRKAYSQEHKATVALKQSVERQRRFVSEASHDLRNPLAGLQTLLEAALVDPDADPQQILRAALHDAERLNDLVSDLLELARLDASAPAPTEPIDLAHFVVEELSTRPSDIAIFTRLEPHVIVEASRIQLARLLGNLLANAHRHATSTIEVVVRTESQDAVVEVMDDGPGIPKAERECVFERFYRGGDARRLDPHGTGLGLSIAREIASAHGGHLYAADCPKGACLVVRFPLPSAHAPPGALEL